MDDAEPEVSARAVEMIGRAGGTAFDFAQGTSAPTLAFNGAVSHHALMNARLLPCPACLRHIRTSEPCCPFCAGAVEFPSAVAPKSSWAETRLSRSARVALGAALTVSALPACAGSGSNPNPPAPVYGGPPPMVEQPPPDESMPLEPDNPGGGEFATPPDGNTSPGSDAGAMQPFPPDEGSMRPKYGAPPPPDPGTARPLYGLPPPPHK